MIWDTSIWRLGCSNHSKIRSAQKCYPCLRYELSPMSPGRTSKRLVGANGFEPSTSWSRTRHLNPINALSGVAYGTTSVISPLSVVPNLYLVWHRAFLVLRSKVLSKQLLADLSANIAPVFEGMLIVKTSVDSRPKDLIEPVGCIVESMCVDPIAEG